MNKSAPVNPEGFPWGTNRPGRLHRIGFALALAVACASLVAIRSSKFPGSRSDFSQARFGAEAILHGGNPYKLSGRGRVFDAPRPVLYPATTYVAAIPFTFVSDHLASVIFVAVSAFLLGYGATAGSWHRLPMFPSIAFLSSIHLAQWSPLMTAAYFLPAVAAIGLVKPQSILPVIAADRSWSSARSFAAGSIVLLAVSFILAPGWLAQWLGVIRENRDLTPPLFHTGGPLILLVLLRWRRKEAWLVALSACMPQTWGWYNTLILLAIARTYREACVLSLVSSAGFMLAVYLIRDSSSPATYPAWGAMMVAFAYLPATIAVLKRPSEGVVPAWLRVLAARYPAKTSRR